MEIKQIIKLFDIPKEIIKDNERQRRVYSITGISPTVLGRTDQAKVLVYESTCSYQHSSNRKKESL